MTSAEPAVRSADPGAASSSGSAGVPPDERKCGEHWGHDWGTGMVIIGVVRCSRCDKLSTVADFPAASRAHSDLWDPNGDHGRDMAGCGEGEE